MHTNSKKCDIISKNGQVIFMSLDEITEFIDNKIEKDSSKVVIGFYELKVKLLPRFTHDAVNTALTKCINEGCVAG